MMTARDDTEHVKLQSVLGNLDSFPLLATQRRFPHLLLQVRENYLVTVFFVATSQAFTRTQNK